MAAFGRYELIAILGQGGFATVHRAHDPVLDRDVAIKVLHGYLAGDEQVRERFVREGRALARIRHPNLVQVYDAGTIDDQTFLAMEFVDGRSLATLSAGRQLPLEEAASIIGQVAGAIDAVHATGLIHRDIKPANIILEATGRAVLLDLGIARDMETTGMTATGMVVGTPGFLAPEQVDSSVFVGPRTDVYQLAATAYTLLAGKPPYEGDTAQVLYSVAHKPPPDLGVERPDLPYQAIAAVTQALAKDPQQRPETATGFAMLLSGRVPADSLQTAVAAPAAASVASDLETVVAPTPVPAANAAAPAVAAPPPQPRSRRPLVIGVAAVLGVIAVVAAVFMLIRSGGEPTSASGDPTATAEAEAFGDIRPDGKEVEVQLEKGTPASLAFRAPASGMVSFVVEDSSTSAAYTVKDRRDDIVGSSTWVNEGGGLVDTIELPAAGDYSLEISSVGAGTAKLVMYEVPRPADKPVTPGTEFEISVDVPGATERVTFDAKAGQRFSLSIDDANAAFQLQITSASDHRELHANQHVPKDGGFVDVFEVDRDDTLAVVADPIGIASLKAHLVLYDLSSEKSTALAVGTPVNFSTTKPGENAVFTFEGKPEQVVSVRTTRIKQGSNLRVIGPDQDEDLEIIWSPSTGVILVAKLPLAGEYRVMVDPVKEALESGTIAFYDVTDHPSVAAAIGGGNATVRTSDPGETARITFQATAGQLVTVRSRGGDGYFATITGPNGDEVRERQWLPANGTFTDLVLQGAGEYEILLESRDRLPASFTLEILAQ